jgi:uncharacterized RDD family membrane protein YckC
MGKDTQTYELAGLTERALALLVDTIIVGVITSAIGFGSGNWFIGGGVFGVLIGGGYQWYFLTRQNGQTIGKMIFDLRVIKTDGTPIADVDAVFRYFGYLINSPLLMLGWILALVDDTRQGLHDKMADTYVVKTERLT